MERFLNKRYKTYKHENLDEMLQELGINVMMRKIAATITTTLELKKISENEYSLNSTMLFLTIPQKFTPGIGQSIKTQDGRNIIDTFHFEGDNKLIEKQVGEKIFLIEREFFDTEMIVTAKVGNVICKSWCKLVD